MKRIMVLVVLLVGIFFMMGCESEQPAVERKMKKAELSGELKMDGSTTVYPIAKTAARVFMQKHPQVTIELKQSSTGEGLASFLNGETDISNATRPPKANEYDKAAAKGMDLQMSVISNDAVVLVVHRDNPLRNLSSGQIAKIFFTGEITDWSEVTGGQKKGKIEVFGTDPRISGTAELFIKKIHKGGKFVAGYEILHPTPTVVPKIASEPDGIAYTPLKWVNSSVVLLSVDGVTPKTETILDTSYKLARKMMMITNGAPKGLEREFINFILSGNGQKIVKEEGFIPIF